MFQALEGGDVRLEGVDVAFLSHYGGVEHGVIAYERPDVDHLATGPDVRSEQRECVLVMVKASGLLYPLGDVGVPFDDRDVVRQ